MSDQAANPSPGSDPSSLPAALPGPLVGSESSFKTATLIGAIRAGDPAAAAQLCSDHWRALDLLARRLSRALPDGYVRAALEAERDDLVQETLTRACTEIRAGRLAYQGAGRLSGWLRTTLRHRLSHRRTYWGLRQTQPLPEGQTTSSPGPRPAAPGPGPETAAMRQEELKEYERLREAIAALDEVQQAIVELHGFHGLSWAEVAAVISAETGEAISADAARMRFATIRRKLALVLDRLP